MRSALLLPCCRVDRSCALTMRADRSGCSLSLAVASRALGFRVESGVRGSFGDHATILV